MRVRVWSLLAGMALGLGHAAAQAPVPVARSAPAAGSVVAAKGGEELQFRAEESWRFVVPQQDLIGGDTVRTNALGALAILFQDRTQIRVGRNSTLLVKDVARGPDGETRLSLPQGSISARAARGGSGVQVDTPAAAAGIRGTDWSLAVEGPKTSLIVMEGEVTLANPHGTVTVRKGEGAEAMIGQAPRKITLVNFDGREQILIYRELRETFANLSPTDLSRKAEREVRRRVLATSEPARTARDWLALAETALTYDGRAASSSALARVDRRSLDARDRARADLVGCFVIAKDKHWGEAAGLCTGAVRNLDPKRRATAEYLAWVARGLDKPNSRPTPPPEGRYAAQSTGIIARASIESFLEGPKKGIAILRENERRFPDDVMMRAGRALLSIMDGDDKQARQAIEAARAIDPDDPITLWASARYRYTVESDLEGALAELQRAVEAAPGNDFIWADISLVQAEREAYREAEAAHLKSIELDPENPINHSNYANFLIDEYRLAEAGEALKAAEAIDPNGYLATVTRGRLLQRRGQFDEGMKNLLAASAINPTYAGGQLEIAIADYQAGDQAETQQALDNADQYDDDNPTIPLIRSVIAVDQFRADDAIMDARESLRRRQAKGGYYATIDANRQNGSFVASALRFLELDEWGRYYGDRVADPFESSAYFDQAIVNRGNPFETATRQVSPEDFNDPGTTAFSSLIQGLLIEPLAVAGSERRTTLAYHPFAEIGVEGGLVAKRGDSGWRNETTLQAAIMEPFPIAIYGNAIVDRPDSPLSNDRDETASGIAIIGAQPTPHDNLALFSVVAKERTDARLFDRFFAFVPALREDDDSQSLVTTSGAAWSHLIGERNVIQAMVAGTTVDSDTVETRPFRFDADSDGTADSIIGLDNREKVRQRALFGGLSHLLGIGDVTLRYGAEGGRSRFRVSSLTANLDGSAFERFDQRDDGDAWRVYGDATWDITRNLKVEAGLYRSSVSIGETGGDARMDPRLGVAWQPLDGHWLRGAYRRDSQFASLVTLAPVTTVGLTPTAVPTRFDGRTETFAARWDAEWSRHLFTAVEYQKQDVDKLAVDIPESFRTADVLEASVDQLTATANVWLTHGFGAFATYTRTWSEAKQDNSDGYFYTVLQDEAVPYLPKHFGRIGLTYVDPAMFKVTVAQNFVGKRNDQRGVELDDFSTTDFAATWELADKRLALSFQALNIFDKRFDLVAPLAANLEGAVNSGRTLIATARVRF